MDNKTIEKDVVTEYLEIEDQLRELEANYRTTQNKLLNYKSLNSLKQKKTKKIVSQNIVFSILVKIAVLILSAIGLAGMWSAIFADVGLCVLAVLNSMRLLNLKNK